MAASHQKRKKNIAQKALDVVANCDDYPKTIETPVSELIGLSDQQTEKGIFTIHQMAEFVQTHETDSLLRLRGKHITHPAIKDIELQIIDSLIDDRIVNEILAPDGYTPASRYLFPCNMLRAEILKAVKYPEISYRKFCGDDRHYENHKETSPCIGMESKQNRAFIALSLNRKDMISHVQMSQFRSSLSFTQMINLNVYLLYLLQRQGCWTLSMFILSTRVRRASVLSPLLFNIVLDELDKELESR